MTGSPAAGEVLDRAIHLTVRRVVPLALPFVIADAAGNALQLDRRGLAFTVLLMFVGMVLENRARVVAIRTLARARGDGIAWGAALRYPGALVYAVIGMLDVGAPYLAFAVAATMFAFAALGRIFEAGPVVGVVFAIGLTLVLVVEVALLAAVMLVAFAAAVATVDTVGDGIAPHRALAYWLREAFRLRSLATSSLAALGFILLVAGVPMLLSLLPLGPGTVRTIVDGVPEGIADAVAMVFAWTWRAAVLERRRGRDIEALLDGTQPAP